MYDSFSQLIDQWESREAFARAVGTTGTNASAMWQRNSIPSHYWSAVVQAAAAKGLKVTFESLSQLSAAKIAPVQTKRQTNGKTSRSATAEVSPT